MATSKLAAKALQLAQADVGKGEMPKGSNWGPYVQGVLASVGIGFAAPWCMAFVYSSFMKAGRDVGVLNPLPKTGGVLTCWNLISKQYRVVGMPQAGDVFIMDFGGGKGHTGIVERVEGVHVHTVEGNTNADGSREGYEVARRKRTISSINKGFLRV